MARSSEVIRQWRLLREIEVSRGVTIRDMAELAGVTTRTIRRDLDALGELRVPRVREEERLAPPQVAVLLPVRVEEDAPP